MIIHNSHSVFIIIWKLAAAFLLIVVYFGGPVFCLNNFIVFFPFFKNDYKIKIS